MATKSSKTTLKKSRLWAAKEAYKAASNNYTNQLSKRENNHLKNQNLLAKKVWAEQKLKQEAERAKKVYADNKNKLKSWAVPAYVSLKGVVRNKWMKKSDVKWTMSEQRNRYYNAMVDADKALDRVNRAWTRKNERAYAEQAYFKAKDSMKAAAKQYNSLKKLKK